jgi:FAD binding domain
MIKPRALDDFRSTLRGDVLLPHDADYDATRRIFNAMIDRRPALIARCASTADVVACIGFARAEALEISVRGGGHNVSGKAVCDGGLMIDLGLMKGCRVDPVTRRAHTEAGLTLAELDRDCQAFGLATPTGIVSSTGIAGLTLGGGIGWLGGKHGLSCDNLESVDIVTADGRLLVVTPTEHPDLFWAVRGGGTNLGVVTAFEYRLHEVGPVLGGGIAWPLARAKHVLPFYNHLARACPDELSLNAGFFTVEDGTKLVGVNVAWIGLPDAGERRLKPLRSLDSRSSTASRPWASWICSGAVMARFHVAAGITGRRASFVVSSRARSMCWSSLRPPAPRRTLRSVSSRCMGRRRACPRRRRRSRIVTTSGTVSC